MSRLIPTRIPKAGDFMLLAALLFCLSPAARAGTRSTKAVAGASGWFSDEAETEDDDESANGLGVPELSGNAAAPAVALLVGGMLLLTARRRGASGRDGAGAIDRR